jgi:hypothetical protein
VANYLKILALLLAGASALGQDEDPLLSAERWYTADYAPLYSDKPWDKAAEIAAHFDTTVHVHGEGGQSYDSLSWITEALGEWKAEGWLRSEIAALEVDALAPDIASFKARWRDFYEGDAVAYECGWYLADLIKGRWRITEYATIECDAHGL